MREVKRRPRALAQRIKVKTNVGKSPLGSGVAEQAS